MATENWIIIIYIQGQYNEIWYKIVLYKGEMMFSGYSIVAEEVTFLLPDVRRLEPSFLPWGSRSSLYNYNLVNIWNEKLLLPVKKYSDM